MIYMKSRSWLKFWVAVITLLGLVAFCDYVLGQDYAGLYNRAYNSTYAAVKPAPSIVLGPQNIIVAPDSARYEQRWQPMLSPDDLRALIFLNAIYGSSNANNVININP